MRGNFGDSAALARHPGGALAAVALIDRLFAPALRWWLRRRVNRAIDELNQRLQARDPALQARAPAPADRAADVRSRGAEGRRGRGQGARRAQERRPRARPALRPGDHAGVLAPTPISASARRWPSGCRPRSTACALGAFERGDALPGAAGRLGGVRHQSSLQHGLRAGHLPGVGELGAELRGGRMGARVGAAGPDPRHGRLFRAPRQLQSALSQGAGALRAHGDHLRRGAGRVPGGRAHARRRAAAAEAGAAQLHGVGLRSQRPARHRVRAGRPQLRPRAGGPRPHGGGRPPRRASGRASPSIRWCCRRGSGKGLWQRIRGTWHRYGYACVSFGRPLSLRGYLAERGIDLRALPEDAAVCRDRAAGAAPDGRGGPRRPGAAGVAGGERHPGRRRARAVEPGAQGRGVRADAPAARRRARTCTSPATTRNTPSTWAAHADAAPPRGRRTASTGANPKEAALLAFYANAIAHLLPHGCAACNGVTP